jgi:hypothetical protein
MPGFKVGDAVSVQIDGRKTPIYGSVAAVDDGVITVQKDNGRTVMAPIGQVSLAVRYIGERSRCVSAYVPETSLERWKAEASKRGLAVSAWMVEVVNAHLEGKP